MSDDGQGIRSAAEELFRHRHDLPADVLRSLADIYVCASSARYGEAHETWWMDPDTFAAHNLAECEAENPRRVTAAPSRPGEYPYLQLGTLNVHLLNGQHAQAIRKWLDRDPPVGLLAELAAVVEDYCRVAGREAVAGSGQMTIEQLRASDVPVSPLMAELLGLPPDSPRIRRPPPSALPVENPEG